MVSIYIGTYQVSTCLEIFTILALESSTFNLRYHPCQGSSADILRCSFAFGVLILPKAGAMRRKEKKPREEEGKEGKESKEILPIRHPKVK
jgi:hypothetical protein